MLRDIHAEKSNMLCPRDCYLLASRSRYDGGANCEEACFKDVNQQRFSNQVNIESRVTETIHLQ